MMSITEHRRNQLHNRVHDVLGVEEGDALMELLPPVGWADVARRSDIDRLRSDMENHVAALRQEIQRASEIQMSRTNEIVMRSQNRIMLVMMGTMLATVIAVSGLAFAAAGLT